MRHSDAEGEGALKSTRWHLNPLADKKALRIKYNGHISAAVKSIQQQGLVKWTIS